MPTGPKDYYIHGDYFAYCDSCKFKFHASELRKDWKGLMKCPGCWESRHPMDFQQPPRPSIPLPWTRPNDETPGQFDVNDEQIDGVVYAGLGADDDIPAGTFTSNNNTL